MKSFSPQSATDEAVLASRLLKQDEREVVRGFHLEAVTSGAQQASPAAAGYQRDAFDTEARLDSNTRITQANDRALRAAQLSGWISGKSAGRS